TSEGVERFTPRRRIPGHSQPELFGLSHKIPARGQASEIMFALRIFLGCVLGRTPQRYEFGFGSGLPGLAGGECLIGQTQVIRISPRTAAGPSLQPRPVFYA